MGPTLAQGPLHARGTPICLTTFLPIAAEPEKGREPVAVEVALPRKDARALGSVQHRLGTQAMVRIHLPRDTAPGRYDAVIAIGERRHAVVLEVEPSPHLVLSPKVLRIGGKPGEKTAVEVVASNLGNVELDIRAVHAFGLYEIEGAENAIGRAFAATEKAGGGAADRLVEELAKGHGGLARIRIDRGKGVLAPGEARALALTFEIPKQVERGRSYGGNWHLHNLRYPVVIAVAEAPGDKGGSP